MVQNILDKLQLKEEKNLLIQGLPSAIEKQFSKLSFAKNVTPLLRTRKIDFALVFAINEKQLHAILKDVMPCLQKGGKLWVSFPKKASKIVTDLDKSSSWEILVDNDFKLVIEITIDHVWNAKRFKRNSDPDDEVEVIEENVTEDSNKKNIIEAQVESDNDTVEVPKNLEEHLRKNKYAGAAYEKLSASNKREFIEWIEGAKKDVTKQKRLKDTIDKLVAGKKNPSEK
jgi:hypothetical protein